MTQSTMTQGRQDAAPTAAAEATRNAARRTPFRYTHNVYFQDGLWLTGVLGALLFIVLAVSLDAAGHVSSGMGTVVPVTFGALLLGVLMSFSRFDSFFAFLHALFVGLAWILYLMTQLPSAEEIAPFLDRGLPELQARAYFVLLRLLNWVDAAINRTASADNYVFIFEISFLVWWISFLGMWSILRFGYVWRVVVPAGLMLIVNAYYAPQPITAMLVVFSVLTLFLLVRTNLSEQQLRWRDQRVYVTNDLTWDYVRTGMTYTVVVLTVVWLLPGLGRNAQIRQLLAPLNEQWEQTSQELGSLYQGLNRRAAAANTDFGRSLPLGGEREVGDSLIFNVNAPSARYWRAVTYDYYDGRGWANTSGREVALVANQPLPVGAWQERAPLTQTISLMNSTGNVVFGAPDVRSVSMPVEALAEGVPINALEAPALGEEFPPAVEMTMLRARETLDIGDQYTVVSNANVATVPMLRAAGTDYPAQIMDRYLQLPEGFSPRVAEQARSLTRAATTPYDTAKTLEAYLRTITYNDMIAAPAPDVDPLEYFLYDIQEGYCDYYASAMAMMLRVLGIPARTASGYAEGMYDEESGLYYVTERDAHTWVEVFFPGIGWTEFEPTAGESPLNRSTGSTETETSGLQDELLSTPNAPANNLPQNQLEQDPGELTEFAAAEQGTNLPWWAWLIITPIALVAGIWLLWKLRISAGPTAFSAEAPQILFERLQRWTGRLGLQSEASQTPLEQAQRWQRALPEGERPIREITASYVRYRFGPRAMQAQPVPVLPTDAATGAPASAAVANQRQNDADAWKTLEPILIGAWIKRWLPVRRRKVNGQYELRATPTTASAEPTATAQERAFRKPTTRSNGRADK